MGNNNQFNSVSKKNIRGAQISAHLYFVLIGRCYLITIRGGFEILNNEILSLSHHKSCRVFRQFDPIRLGDKYATKAYLKKQFVFEDLPNDLEKPT